MSRSVSSFDRACGSSSVRLALGSWRVAFLSLFVLNIPLPFTRWHLRCRECGYTACEARLHREAASTSRDTSAA